MSTTTDNAGAESPIIEIRNITKRYGEVLAVDDNNLQIKRGEFFALLGPSGCGKTTLLRMMAGFEIPTSGEILIDGQDMAGAPPNQRPVNMVFQSYAVFPHMSVIDNVAYGLKIDGVAKDQRYAEAQKALELVKLGEYGQRKPDQLSGGQRQRVALARALVKKPKVLLLDEPLSALDAKLRADMRTELTELQFRVGLTFVMVTHDQDEALSMADRIAVMERGRIVQIAAPGTLYEKPKSRFVADFIGSVNLLEGKVVSTEADVSQCTIDIAELHCSVPASPDQPLTPGRAVCLALRPEKIILEHRTPGPDGSAPVPDCMAGCDTVLPGVIEDYSYLGAASEFGVRLDCGAKMRVTHINEERSLADRYKWDQPVWIGWRADAPIVLTD